MKVLCCRIFAVTVVLGITSLFWRGGPSSLPLILLAAATALFLIGGMLKSEKRETLARFVFALGFIAMAALTYWGFSLLPQGTIFGRGTALLFYWVEMLFFAEVWLVDIMCPSCTSNGIWS